MSGCARSVYPESRSFATILGNDIAGVVREVGELVTWVSAGDEVMVQPGVSCGHCAECFAGRDNFCRDYDILGYRRAGGYAELVAVPGENIMPKPKSLSWEEAAALPLVTVTAWHMLVTRAQVQPGTRVDSCGGIVSARSAFKRKLAGARVIATPDMTTNTKAKTRRREVDPLSNRLDPKVRALTNRAVLMWCRTNGGDTCRFNCCSQSDGPSAVGHKRYDARTDLANSSIANYENGSFMGTRMLWRREVGEAGAIRAVVDQTLPWRGRRAQALMETALSLKVGSVTS